MTQLPQALSDTKIYFSDILRCFQVIIVVNIVLFHLEIKIFSKYSK